ncbi:hypothetical protein [Pusillimonas noertemannii]|uniref:Uncharacterized protein n=1 Tax=Pusillimonas noertemannii TaxID=305977 RepID=A0A2U1CME1_9BURK|nr:hypothetical protein [Pusillimonas noertemannii]NYT68801.1 hypothetical protein [Pusillimonas noertemannii]PVY62175.1 hypothetical protein C7440_1668 [Pusillimonas noertemannii]TFL10837.1 hypothetical protein CSC72_10015 [Pusillimonas noertemannii]
MTVSNANYLKQFHDAGQALGAKVINSDFTLEIEGFEQNYLLCKQAPWPELSPSGEIEVPTPLGAAAWEAQQLRVNHQGQVAFMETVAGSIDQMLVDIIAGGGKFNAKVYEGTPQKYLNMKRIVDCFMVMDNPDRDWENRSQVLLFNGTMFYHYFGEKEAGNSSDYR